MPAVRSLPRLSPSQWLDGIALAALGLALLGAPLAGGAHTGWPLAAVQLAILAALLAWALAMLVAGRLEWRRTSLDLPLALFAVLVLAQLAIGNGPLVRWALAPAPTDVAAPAALPALWSLGTVSPAQTARSFRLFLTYAAAYVLVVNLVRTRVALDRLVRLVIAAGGGLAFFALIDYLVARGRLSGSGARGRLAGTFANPDHFAAWLAMAICLGLGYVLARARTDDDAGARGRSRRDAEALARRAVMLIAVAVMAVALVFTLSRGGVLSLAAALAGFVLIQGAAGRTRTSVVLVALLLAVTIGVGAWIGLEPLLQRFRADPYVSRLVQLRSSLDMVGAFPLLGVGLGAYRDIYFRYQPPELLPGRMYFPFAHDDWLQLVVETGAIGTLVILFAVWRAAADLVGAHVLGRATCPVGGGDRDGARRHDAWSLGVALGGISGALALAVHSALDFGARIPANGLLAAACLGIATVALHTRFAGAGGRVLTAVRVRECSGRSIPIVAGVVAAVLALACVPAVVRAPLVEARLEAAREAPAARVERALALLPDDAEARWARARLRLAAARRLWETGQRDDGPLLTTWDDRRRAALPLFDGAAGDLAVALRARPSDPFLHDALAWAQGGAAAIDDAPPGERQATAVAALRRAIALQPANPFLYRSLAALALSQRPPLVPTALDASREAIARDPSLLPELAARFLPLRLDEQQWAALVPDTAIDHLELAVVLDGAGLAGAADSEYRRAASRGTIPTQVLAHLLLGRALLRRGDPARALAEIDAAIALDPGQPEAHLLRASALDARGDAAGALDAARAAVARADAASPLARTARERAIAERLLGPGARGPERYQRALGDILLARQLWPPAVAEWQSIAQRSPTDARAQFQLGTALDGAGRSADALEAYRRAVALDPAAAPYRLALARSLWDGEQFYQAIHEWQAVLAADPSSLEARLALGRAYRRTGEAQLAAREYQRALEIAPGNEEARRALGRTR